MLKKIISFIFSLLVSWIVTCLGYEIFKRTDIYAPIVFISLLVVIFILVFFIMWKIFYYKIFKNLKTAKEYFINLSTFTKDIINYTDISSENTKYYNIAEQEINTNNVDKGLWALSLVKSKGNEELRKAEYIKLRVKQLKSIDK